MATPVPTPKRICPLTTKEIVEKLIIVGEMIAGLKLYNYQRVFVARCMESVINNDASIITALWSRQSGKTEAVAVLVLSLLIMLPILAAAFPDDPRLKPYSRGFRAGIFAPIDEQAKIAFSRVRQYIHSDNGQRVLSDPEIDVQVTVSRGDTIAFSNGSYFQARSASPDSQIEGKTFELVICEESQKLSREKVEKEIRPMLASTNGSMVKIGTAWESRGGFHTDIQANIALHRAGGVRNHYEFPYTLVVEERKRMFDKDGNPYHLNYGKFVAAEIARLGGTDSIEFKMNFLCLWNESRIVAVSEEDIQRSLDVHREMAPDMIGVQVAGLDLGKKADRTVLTTMRIRFDLPSINVVTGPKADEENQLFYPKEIVSWLDLEGSFDGTDGQYVTLVRYLQLTAVKLLVVDATGMGGDIVSERLQNMLGETITVVPFVFSAPRKSELYKNYIQELGSGRVRVPAGPMTVESIQYKRWVHEHLSLDKESMGLYTKFAAISGEHDDYPDSSALAVWAERILASATMPVIEVSGGMEVTSSRQQEQYGRGSRYQRRGGLFS
jgi:hypothetical protein